MKKFLLLTTIISLLATGCTNSNDSEKASKASEKKTGAAIPDYVYENTTSNDKFAQVLELDKKVVFFAGPNCSQGNAKKNYIKKALVARGLGEYYYYLPNLNKLGSMRVSCSNGSIKCVQIFLLNNCGDGVCIINPAKKRYYKLKNYEQIGQIAENLKDW